MNLLGKRVLVTGSAKRVGAHIVKSLANCGATCLIHCNKSIKEANELLLSLPGTNHQVFQVDLSKEDSAKELFQQAGRVDVLINNASVYFDPTIPEEEVEKLNYQINYLTPLHLMKLTLSQAGPGCVINILDQEVLNPTPLRGSYSISKRMLKEATLEYAFNFARKNWRVNAIAPGPVLPPDYLINSKMTKTLAKLPLNRKVNLDDLANSVKFLIENESITGAILPVDCGQHLGVINQDEKI